MAGPDGAVSVDSSWGPMLIPRSAGASLTRDEVMVATSEVDGSGRDSGRGRRVAGAAAQGSPGTASRPSFSHPDSHRRLPARDPPAPHRAATGRGLVQTEIG